ncbi:MAG: hypothetical protein ACXWL2_03135 [Candidatus Chromulinivorax sp.]
MNKSLQIISIIVLIGVLFDKSVEALQPSDLTPVILTTGVIGAVGTLVYYTVDSNNTLLTKVDKYLEKIDACQDLLPPVGWTDTKEAYFTQWLENKFEVKLADLQCNRLYTNKIVIDYVYKMQNLLTQAENCIWWRSYLSKSMTDKLQVIKDIKLLLEQALIVAQEYQMFLYAHEIINFYDTLFVKHSRSDFKSHKEKQAIIIKWMRRGFYSDTEFPVLNTVELMILDMEWMRICLSTESYKVFYPQVVIKLEQYEAFLEETLDCVVDSSAYQSEKKAQDIRNFFSAEFEKIAALQERAAQAQEEHAYEIRKLRKAQEEKMEPIINSK